MLQGCGTEAMASAERYWFLGGGGCCCGDAAAAAAADAAKVLRILRTRRKLLSCCKGAALKRWFPRKGIGFSAAAAAAAGMLLRRTLRRSCETVAAAERRGCYRKTWLHWGQQHPWNGACCRKRRFCSGSVIEKGKLICFPLLSQLMQTHLRRKTGRLRDL